MDGARVFNAAGVVRRAGARDRGQGRHGDVLPVEGAGRAGRLDAGRDAKSTIAQARLYRKRLGGGMRQAGVLAAAGLVALEETRRSSPEIMRNARFLAEGLAAIPGIQIDPRSVQSNIVIFDVSGTGLAPRGYQRAAETARRADEWRQPAADARRDALRRGPRRL